MSDPKGPADENNIEKDNKNVNKKHIINSVRKENIEIFLDTINFINEDNYLSNAVEESVKKTVIYNKGIEVLNKFGKPEEVRVNQCRSFEAAIKLHNEFPNKRIGVLNFASATTPGGGVTNGSTAQEESLCRVSTLYNVLNTQYLFDHFYNLNRNKNNPLHDDTVIYSPDIVICKSDSDKPIRLKKEDFIKVDVLTCAAPNLREKPWNLYNFDGDVPIIVSDDDLYQIHIKRAKRILDVALINNIDILVLGAFGCGAFKNNPYVVAKAYKDTLKKYKNCFELIEFAIFTSEYNKENYYAFKSIINN